jgi:hypothetical protein
VRMRGSDASDGPAVYPVTYVSSIVDALDAFASYCVFRFLWRGSSLLFCFSVILLCQSFERMMFRSHLVFYRMSCYRLVFVTVFSRYVRIL